MNQKVLYALLASRRTLSRSTVNLAARASGPDGGRPPFTGEGTGPNLSPEQRRRMRMQAVEEEHREKTQKAPEFDTEEDTSFQSNF